MANKLRLNTKDRDIFSSLCVANRPIPIKKLAEKSKMSWKTANEHIRKLKSLKIVKIDKSVRRTNVSIDPSFINKILHPIDRIILLCLSVDLFATSNQVAKAVHIHGETARKHLDKLMKLGFLILNQRGNRNYWKLKFRVEMSNVTTK